MSASLSARTRELLSQRPYKVTFRRIVEENPDAGFTIQWLHHFEHNKLKTYDADRVQTLFEYLAKRPLDVA